MHAVEKILAEASGKREVRTGEIVNAKVDVAMVHERAGPRVAESFDKIGAERVWDPSKVVVTFDHNVPPPTVENAEAQKRFKGFLKKYGLRNVFPGGTGICHQVLPEKGFAWPGTVIVGTDSHTVTYGAFGAFATGIGHTEMASVLALGEIWLRVPRAVRVEVKGKLPPGVMAKDVVLRVAKDVGEEGALYDVIDFVGSTIRGMSVDGRMVLCNMSVEMGAKAGFVEADRKTLDYVGARTGRTFVPIKTDPKYDYEREWRFNVGELEPQVALPHSVANVRPVSEVGEVRVDQALIGTCTGGRLEDLRAAAMILKGRRVSPETRLVVVPASLEVYLQALKDGLMETLLHSGAIVCPPGCGPCTGGHMGVLASGEVCVSAANRNFRGRMGSLDSLLYLASPATVAASAVEGRITDPRKYI